MKKQKEIITAADLQQYLLSISPKLESSSARIIIGNPETRIKKVGTAWTPYVNTLAKAVKQGINVLVVYAPTFYMDEDPEEFEKLDFRYFNSMQSPARENYTTALLTKKKWIERNELVIIRCHHLLNLKNIPVGFAEILGCRDEDIVSSKDYYYVYKVEKDTALNISSKIALNLKELNQPGVAFYGDPNRTVSTIGIGTGEMCDPRSYSELNPDLCIGVDDTIWTWLQTSYAEDTGNPLIVINQGTSEEMGVRLLNEHLSKHIPSLEFLHMNQGCDYKWVIA